jgi:hypothetical protein
VQQPAVAFCKASLLAVASSLQVNSIFTKLDASSAEAVSLGFRLGLILV